VERREEPMGVRKYRARTGSTMWMVDLAMTINGRQDRYRKKGIPTRELAIAHEADVRARMFRDGHFGKPTDRRFTVSKAWELYRPVSERHRSHPTEKGIAGHLTRLLGGKKVVELNQADVDQYRVRRRGEVSKRGGPPSPTTLDREVELLKRIANYAVKAGKLATSPLAGGKLLKEPNARASRIEEEAFGELLRHAPPHLRSVMTIAFDTGMRLKEILRLRWDQVVLTGQRGKIILEAQDTKTRKARIVPLTARAREELQRYPRHLTSRHVFTNPATGKSYEDIGRSFTTATLAADLKGLWFHDLRRSYITNARKRGIPESVIMQITGHRTRAVFQRYNIVSEEDLFAAAKQYEDGTYMALDEEEVPERERPPRKCAEALEKK